MEHIHTTIWKSLHTYWKEHSNIKTVLEKAKFYMLARSAESSAGTGIVHSEFNHSKDNLVHFLQIWFLPKEEGMKPSHEQINFNKAQRTNILLPVASDQGNHGSALIKSPVTMCISYLESSKELNHTIASGRGCYIFVAEGRTSINGVLLNKGDAASVVDQSKIQIRADQDSEIVVFDVAL